MSRSAHPGVHPGDLDPLVQGPRTDHGRPRVLRQRRHVVLRLCLRRDVHQKATAQRPEPDRPTVQDLLNARLSPAQRLQGPAQTAPLQEQLPLVLEGQPVAFLGQVGSYHVYGL